jgi:adenylyltransferase/sulfurtransferase
MAMPEVAESPIHLTEDRFTRLRAIEWWDQARLQRARVLVIGAGALGNEVVKNLALLGIGNLVIADMDHVEVSNLCRSVLFRPEDEGRPKAVCAARAARSIYPGLNALPFAGNILSDLGLGYFRWAEVVVGALDNREARVFVNSACARVARPWVDGGIEVLNGIVRGFAPPQSACYECTMGQRDWDQLNQRRSCSLLARRAISAGGTPTTPTTAAVIGAMQTQEVVKRLHGLTALTGAGFVFEGLGHSSYQVSYPIAPDCPWHETPAPIEAVADFGQQTPLRQVWTWAEQRLGGVDALDFSRELVESLTCPRCTVARRVLRPIDRITESQAVCPTCGAECVPQFVHSLEAGSPLLDLTIGSIGLPPWDVLWARRGDRTIGMEMAHDRSPELRDPARASGS